MKIYALMTKGAEKSISQDSVLVGNNILSEGYLEYTVAEGESVVVAVADGVGGNKAGEVASFLAVNGVRNGKLFVHATVESVQKLIQNTNQNILNISANNMNMNNMATTLTGICIAPQQQIAFHIGNTRLCRRNGIYLQPLTIAHEDMQGRLTNCMGINPELLSGLQVWDASGEIKPGQDLILTTDGIHDHIPDDEMDDILQGTDNIRDILLAIEDKARENGSMDDISIVWVSKKE